MSAGQRSGTGATVELEDEKVRKNDILSNRDKSQRSPGRGLDGKGVQADEYKDPPTNSRGDPEGAAIPDVKAPGKQSAEPPAKAEDPKPTDDSEQVDRPGFDLGGSTGQTHAGKGLGLGEDAKKGRKGWGLPR